MKHASPATVSRGGVLFINETDVGWKPYVALSSLCCFALVCSISLRGPLRPEGGAVYRHRALGSRGLAGHVHIFTCMHIYVPICACMYSYVHICTCMNVYVHVCTYMYMHVHVCTYMYMYAHICTYMYLYVHICTYMYIYVHACTYIYIYSHICKYMYMILRLFV